MTGGVPRYAETFSNTLVNTSVNTSELFSAIETLVLNEQSYLFDEPTFLLRNEVTEVGSYFSIIKSIAAGNQKLSRICTDLCVKQSSLTKYLRTLMDLDILERQVPITEENPEKSKMGLYHIKDNFIEFWFKFFYPYRDRIEQKQFGYIMNKIKSDFVKRQVAFVYENVCKEEMWKLCNDDELQFDRIGRWWNKDAEVDLVAIDKERNSIIFCECKFTEGNMGVDVFYKLVDKAKKVPFGKKDSVRNESYVLFCINGYDAKLMELAVQRKDLRLFENKSYTAFV